MTVTDKPKFTDHLQACCYFGLGAVKTKMNVFAPPLEQNKGKHLVLKLLAQNLVHKIDIKTIIG